MEEGQTRALEVSFWRVPSFVLLFKILLGVSRSLR